MCKEFLQFSLFALMGLEFKAKPQPADGKQLTTLVDMISNTDSWVAWRLLKTMTPDSKWQIEQTKNQRTKRRNSRKKQ
jgi:hypothetical protein